MKNFIVFLIVLLFWGVCFAEDHPVRWTDYDINIYEKKGMFEDDEYGGSDIYITLLAWGDFNNDSIEDILLLTKYFIKGATFRFCEHALLTRLEENSKLIDISDQLEY